MKSYNDFAIPLAWPDQTAYGDEKWMAFLKKCGIVKNLNFKVGHAAILLVCRSTGTVEYFDFGRYVAPRGDGRARSKNFDPRLKIQSVAILDSSQKHIANLKAILNELSTMESATHGGGRLLLSVVPNINFKAARAFAQNLVKIGPVPYGAFAANNNSCSRFVAQVLIASMPAKDSRIRKIKYSETFKPSPTGNIVNTRQDGHILCYEHGLLQKWKMNRFDSLHFQWKLIRENLQQESALTLGNDSGKDNLIPPPIPAHIPDSAQWLGGIGEGMWFHLSSCPRDLDHYFIRSYTKLGETINEVRTSCPQGNFCPKTQYDIAMQLDGQHFTVVQQGIKYLLKKVTHHTNSITSKVV